MRARYISKSTIYERMCFLKQYIPASQCKIAFPNKNEGERKMRSPWVYLVGSNLGLFHRFHFILGEGDRIVERLF